MPDFLVPHPRTSTAVLLASAAADRGLHVIAEAGTGPEVHWYGGPLAARRAGVRERLGVGLLEPRDEWLSTLPYELTRRRVALATLADAWALEGPAFVKPPSDKSVPAAVYATGRELPREGERIGPGTPVLISDVVEFTAEYRLFVLDGEVVTGSRYAVYGRLDPGPLTPGARDFGRRLLDTAGRTLPSAVVVDIGRLAGAGDLHGDDGNGRQRAGGHGDGADAADHDGWDHSGHDPDRADDGSSLGVRSRSVRSSGGRFSDGRSDGVSGGEHWAVVEANMPWFAHSYAALPDRVLDVVLRASGPRHRVAPRDVPFLR
ncbi:ATP-grasp domain-containing protein [Streptomyces sp. NPDC051018]|uniref:ATP-grasp domain-containing protein n=1 Tax=Streptomyces sp. NPDC051018 TaxID=3365639 RepID=UPI00379ECAC5